MEGREEASGDDLTAGDLAIGEFFVGQAASLPSVADKWGHADHGA